MNALKQPRLAAIHGRTWSGSLTHGGILELSVCMIYPAQVIAQTIGGRNTAGIQFGQNGIARIHIHAPIPIRDAIRQMNISGAQ